MRTLPNVTLRVHLEDFETSCLMLDASGPEGTKLSYLLCKSATRNYDPKSNSKNDHSSASLMLARIMVHTVELYGDPPL